MYQKAHQGIDILGRACGAALAAFLIFGSAAQAAGSWNAFLNPDNSLSFSFLPQRSAGFSDRNSGAGDRTGPGWECIRGRRPRAIGSRLRVPFVVNKDKGEVIDVQFQAWQPAARQVAFRYDLDAAQDVPLTHADRRRQLRDARQPGDAHPDARRRQADASSRCPCAASTARRPRRRPSFAFEKGGTVTMQIDPPCPIALRQRHARGAGVRRVPARASGA